MLKKISKPIIALSLLCFVCRAKAQEVLPLQIGEGIDVGYRSPYANNNWLPGVAVDYNLHLAKNIGQW